MLESNPQRTCHKRLWYSMTSVKAVALCASTLSHGNSQGNGWSIALLVRIASYYLHVLKVDTCSWGCHFMSWWYGFCTTCLNSLAEVVLCNSC